MESLEILFGLFFAACVEEKGEGIMRGEIEGTRRKIFREGMGGERSEKKMRNMKTTQYTCTNTHAHTHTRTYAHTRAHAYTHTHTRTHTHAHTHTHTHTYTRARTHARTHRDRIIGLDTLYCDRRGCSDAMLTLPTGTLSCPSPKCATTAATSPQNQLTKLLFIPT